MSDTKIRRFKMDFEISCFDDSDIYEFSPSDLGVNSWDQLGDEEQIFEAVKLKIMLEYCEDVIFPCFQIKPVSKYYVEVPNHILRRIRDCGRPTFGPQAPPYANVRAVNNSIEFVKLVYPFYSWPTMILKSSMGGVALMWDYDAHYFQVEMLNDGTSDLYHFSKEPS